MICKKCGTELTEDIKFCLNCGEPVGQVGKTKTNEVIENGSVMARKKSIAILLFAMIVIVFAITGFAAYKFYFMPKQEYKEVYTVVEGCFDALQNGDIDEALTYTNYDIGVEFSEYLLSSENIKNESILKNLFISFIKTEGSWKDVI